MTNVSGSRQWCLLITVVGAMIRPEEVDWEIGEVLELKQVWLDMTLTILMNCLLRTKWVRVITHLPWTFLVSLCNPQRVSISCANHLSAAVCQFALPLCVLMLPQLSVPPPNLHQSPGTNRPSPCWHLCSPVLSVAQWCSMRFPLPEKGLFCQLQMLASSSWSRWLTARYYSPLSPVRMRCPRHGFCHESTELTETLCSGTKQLAVERHRVKKKGFLTRMCLHVCKAALSTTANLFHGNHSSCHCLSLPLVPSTRSHYLSIHLLLSPVVISKPMSRLCIGFMNWLRIFLWCTFSYLSIPSFFLVAFFPPLTRKSFSVLSG